LIKKNNQYLNIVKNKQSITSGLNILEIGNFSAVPLMFQTGYLTVDYIKRINKTKNYFLYFPNHEVRSSFFTYLLSDITAYDDHNDIWTKK
jgi:hypothetical protein